ncbi:hypothetical protein [Umezawaea sp. NPDC059074]|uniref:fibronectin type III domain-containing protein n=1 Tax=Umezawaea sp. NPDC059074 TaxID=3346716 RepID=UPI00368B654A
MRSIGLSDTGARNLVVAEILGAQIAWWQLGFALRRAVLRAARRGTRFPEPDVWHVAVAWAGQWLAAPRWWRLLRGVGATVLAMVCFAALTSGLAGVDELVALSGAVTAGVPLAAGWAWREARRARSLVRLAADPPPERASSRSVAVRALITLFTAGAAATTLLVANAHERSSWPECPSFTIDAAVRDWWARDRLGCPTGDTLVGVAGLRYTPWTSAERFTGRALADVVYLAPSGPLMLPRDIFLVWATAGGPSGLLGQPVDAVRNDLVSFVNFRGGSVVANAEGTPTLHIGQSQSASRAPDSACAPHDRPCVTAAFADADGIHLAWQFGTADAFNVAWWPRGEPELAAAREVAGYEVTLPDLRPSTEYVLEVAACRKQFLRRSLCTWQSPPVTVRVG